MTTDEVFATEGQNWLVHDELFQMLLILMEECLLTTAIPTFCITSSVQLHQCSPNHIISFYKIRKAFIAQNVACFPVLLPIEKLGMPTLSVAFFVREI